MEKAADGTVQATALGRQLQRRYAEILVDEYQDTTRRRIGFLPFYPTAATVSWWAM